MKSRVAFAVLPLLFVLAGCGSDDKGRNNVSAPVNNIQDNIETLDASGKAVRDANAARNKELDNVLKKK